MKNYPPKYIVVCADGIFNPTAYLYELEDKPKTGNTWRPNPDAPEYARKVSGNYSVIREMAVKLNKAEDAYREELAAHEAKKKAAKACGFKGCRGIAVEGGTLCDYHGRLDDIARRDRKGSD